MQLQGTMIVAGNLVEDIVVRPVSKIEYGFTVWVDSIEHHLGGNGANTSYTLSKLGIPVRLRGAVGPDDCGRRVLTHLRGAGVNLEEIETLPQATATTVVLVAVDGSRSFLHAPGVSREVFPEPGRFEGTPGHFHLASIFSLPRMRHTGPETLHRAKLAGWTTSLDAGHDTQGAWGAVLEPCWPHIDILFANEAEAQKISGLEDLRAAAKLFLLKGVQTFVLKRGANGCAVFQGEKELWAKGFPIEAVDTTGAGDCFNGGFLAGLHQGATLEESARLANACGALSASSMGGVSGAKTLAETLLFADGYSTKGTLPIDS